MMMLTMPTASHAALRVLELRCESKASPLGIDVANPRLSWQIESDKRGTMQSAYELHVASSMAILQSGRADLWNSGKVAGDQSIGVEYAGNPLTSGMQCYWSVTIWDQDGSQATSAASVWEMGLLRTGDWSAKWIDAPQSQPKSAPIPTQPASKPSTRQTAYPPNVPPLLRKEFEVGGDIARARLYVTALGLYHFWINGQRIGDSVLTPDWTDYRKRVRYQTYDVTDLLHRGTNAAGAILGDGWYAGHVGWLPGHVYGERPALLAQLVIDFSDGTRQVVGTDATWRTALGPLLQSDMLDGEDYDARREFPGWSEPGFDDSVWLTPGHRDEHPPLEAQIAPPVRETQELSVKKVSEPKPGQLVFDLGQNMVGFVRLKVSGERGTKLTLRFAEMLNPDGTIYTENLRAAKATDTYTLKGGGEETWEPSFTFHGFRYVELTGYPGQPPQGTITGVVIGSDNRRSGQWECSDPLLSQLQSNIVWGQRGNFVSVPTDCPQRNERLGWMGDAEVFIRTATFNYDVQEFFNNWLVDVIDSQGATGGYSDVSPRVAAGEGVAAWADAGVICPWTIYQVYGDKRIISRQYDSMARYIDYLKSHSTDLIRPAKGYGDWLSIKADTPKDVLATAYFAYSAHLMAKMAKAIGKDDDAAKYQKLFEDIRKAFNQKFVNPDGKITGDTQTCYLLALKFELLDESRRPDAARRLVQDIRAKDWHLSTGFVGVSFILPMLTQFGHLDVAYRLLDQTTFPSWLFSVKQGATTIWERWDGWTPDKGFQTPTMNSFNHYSLGSCGEWMYDSVAGIGLDEAYPGFKHIIIRPQSGGDLSWARASYDSPYGPIKTDWKTNGGKLNLAVTIPPNTSATIYVPGSNVTESGAPAASAAGVKVLAAEAGASIFEVGSGNYVFEARLP